MKGKLCIPPVSMQMVPTGKPIWRFTQTGTCTSKAMVRVGHAGEEECSEQSTGSKKNSIENELHNSAGISHQIYRILNS